MKKTLIWIGTVIGAGAIMSLLFDTVSQRTEPQIISVNGECLTTAPKDKTAITLRVSTLAPNTVDSMRAAIEQITQITEYLKTQPVETQTTQFNSYEKTEWNRNEQKSVSLGIETTIALEISASNIETIENILEKFAGMPNVFSENLRIFSSPATLNTAQEECLGIAVKNARKRANSLASGDNKRVGKMLSVSYGTNASNPTTPTNLLRSKIAITESSSAFDTSGTIVATDTDVSVSVSAVFEIK